MKNIIIMNMTQNASPYSDMPQDRKCLTTQSRPTRAIVQIVTGHDMSGF